MIDAFINAFKDRPSDKLTQLFSITKKKKAAQFCKKLVLDNFDLESMIIGCGHIGYFHIPRFFDTDPNHLWEKMMRDRNPENFRRMFNQLRKEQRRTFFHFFVLQSDTKIWHLFFGDTSEDGGESRFVGGAHIHFISYLWDLNFTDIFDRLPDRPGASVHIKT